MKGHIQRDPTVKHLYLEEEDERDEEHRGVDVVVEQQHGLVVVHHRQHARRVDAVQRHEHRGQHAGCSAHEREVYLPLDAQNEAQDDHQQRGAGQHAGGLGQNEVGEDHVENQRQTPGDVI